MLPVIQFKDRVNLIQKVRLIHALTESDFQVDISEAEFPKFELLCLKFNIPLVRGNTEGFDITPFIKLLHAEPSTCMGNLLRPLIFPQVITRYCRSLWRQRRRYRFTFTGLITPQRRELITHWTETELKQSAVQLPNGNNFSSKVLRHLRMDDTQKKEIGELLIWFSRKGRKYPIKAWDEEYYRILANSQFVLCPNGDYVWSYRFFEAILCGAMPIVQDECPVYKGFRYLNFNQSVPDVKWSADDAEYNYRLCVEKITVPLEELNAELRRLISV